ncbi:MAG TPA: carboxypeptidase regulatory-like domain-containing protein [Bryobacteraceae bacterium]|nr:carboxypeptidase regulatory-like domain-containing protein [Bryobacteraceae bacterium]
MSKIATTLFIAAAVAAGVIFPVRAQAPTGIITGTVTDESGAVIPNATVTITNKGTGFNRTATTNNEGLYSAPALSAGDYDVRVEATGFRPLIRQANVLAGGSTTVNLPMQVGGTQDVITVEAASSQINYDSHSVQGVIDHQDIEELPLNGRSYMQLASLEPGVTIANGSTAQFNALFTVSVLGAGNRTLFTIDGGSVSDNIDTASGISSMNFSQETVQEFQLSSLNFDLSTGVTAGGAINVVTRSGSNDFHGSGYFFYRDHNMAAYPALQRNAVNPDPFFARRNPGMWLGGPLKKDKLFFFFNFEHTNQVQALTVQPNLPSFAALTGTYGSPYVGKLLGIRWDYRINSQNTLFLRYSHDGNSGFGDVFSNGDPSNWVHNKNWADQSIIGWTSVITPAVVNDLRFQFQYWNNHNDQATPADCVFPCVGGTLPSLFAVIGSNFGLGNAAIGPNFNAPQARNTRRYELTESLSWQLGSHRLKFGADSNRATSAGLWGFCTPLCTAVFAPDYIRGLGLSSFFPTLPTTIKSDADFLNLPVWNQGTQIWSGLGVGSVSTPAPYDYSQNKPQTVYRAYVQDVWKIRPSLTINYGLAWNAQVGFYNTDLSKPQFLAPIFGANNLGPTNNNWHEMQPAVGFAWSPFKDNKTVIRGGAGIYWDGTPGYYKLREPASIGPLGDGRSTLPASALTNTIPGIINLSAGSLIPVGAPLPLSALTTMTLGQFLQIYNQEIGGITAKITPPPPRSGAFTTTGIDVSKSGVEIYPPGGFPLGRTYQMSVGVQRDLGHDMVLTADYARRVGVNISLGERDMNLSTRYINGVASPVIRPCAASELFVPGIECSSGSITVWTDQGRSVYNGLLVKLNKRFSKRYQFQASYAYQSEYTDVGTSWNETNWMAGWGPVLPHQNLNIAGVVHLPWGFELSFNSSAISRGPASANVSSIELPGTVASGSSEPLPGLPYNCLGYSCGKSDLAKAVANWNSTYAGTKDAKGTVLPQLVLPTNYQLGDPTFAQDFRLTKFFTFKERYRLSVFGEMFNALNIANLAGYSFTLDTKNANPAAQTFAFGQPTQRAFQSFGSTGPRAVQVGARFNF